MNKLFKVVAIGGLYIIGGVIIKQLYDVQKEIEYFEGEQDIWKNRKEYEKDLKDKWGI